MLRALFASVAASGLAAALALIAGCGGSSSSSDSHPDAATPGSNAGSEAGGGNTGDAAGGGACSCGIPFPVVPAHAAACASCVTSQCASAVLQCTAVCCPATDDTCANGGIAPLTQCATSACPADCSACVDAPALTCAGGASGHACATGSTPGQGSTTLACSGPAGDAGEADVCCFAWTFGTAQCIPKDTFDGVNPACPALSYGFECSAGSTPSAVDPALACSAGTPDVGGTSDYCCTLH